MDFPVKPVSAYCLSQVPDIVSSARALERGLKEVGIAPHPLMRASVCAGLVVADKALQKRSKWAPRILRALVAGWFIYLAVHNELEIRRWQR